jgi:hypothetical protein
MLETGKIPAVYNRLKFFRIPRCNENSYEINASSSFGSYRAGKREKVSKAFTAQHPNTALYPVPQLY